MAHKEKIIQKIVDYKNNKEAKMSPDKMFKDAVSKALQRRDDLDFIQNSSETQQVLAEMNNKKRNI